MKAQFFILQLVFFIFSVDATGKNTFTTVSGRQISVSTIHRLHPHVDESALPHLLFEHNKETNKLTSHHSSIQLPPIHERFNIPSYPIIYSLNGVHQSKTDDEAPLISKSNDGHTFIFDKYGEDNNTLTYAWGPNLLLHSIGERSDIFINSFNYGSKSIHQVHPSPITIPENCSKSYIFEMELGYDVSFCALHNHNATLANNTLRVLMHYLKIIFIKTVCVIPKILYLQSNCNTTDARDQKFSQPSILSTCNTKENDCERSKIMLELARDEWESLKRGHYTDGAFLFSGYGGGTSLAGASYRGQVCNRKLSYAWIITAIPVVFAHELGHILGARHDDEGLMTAVVSTDNGQASLSRNSQAAIKKFIERDSRSWCLRREAYYDTKLYGQWSWTGDVVTPSFDVSISPAARYTTHNLISEYKFILYDLTFAGKGSDYLISLLSYKADEEHLELYFDVSTLAPKTPENDHRYEKENFNGKELDKLNFEKKSFMFGTAYGNIKNSMSDDIVLFHLRSSPAKNGKERISPFYRVGYNMNLANATLPSQWSEERRIENVGSRYIECASIATGHILSNTTTDLLYIHIDEPLKGKGNIMSYIVGFDMSQTGYIRGGWSGLIEIPGWYGEPSKGVSASLIDVDKNGMIDLVVFHSEVAFYSEYLSEFSRIAGHIRIGKDLNSTGHVTGGWSDFVRVPEIWPQIHEIFNLGITEINGKYFVGLPKSPHETTLRENTFSWRLYWRLYINSQVFGRDLMSTCADIPVSVEISQGCNECYASNDAEQCIRDLSTCQSYIDEVNIDDNASNNSPTTSSEYEDANEEGRKQDDGDDDESYYPIKESIFCEGFHYLLHKPAEDCDFLDKERVLANGLEQVFTQIIKEDDPEISNKLKITSLIEDPAATHGNSLPIAVQAKINGKWTGYRDAVLKAFKKLKERPDFMDHFADPLSTNVKLEGNEWIVRFYLKHKILPQA